MIYTYCHTIHKIIVLVQSDVAGWSTEASGIWRPVRTVRILGKFCVYAVDEFSDSTELAEYHRTIVVV